MSQVIFARRANTQPLTIDASMTLWRMIDGTASNNIDFVMTRIDGVHSRRVNRRSAKLYHVQEGQLSIVTDSVTVSLGAGDVAIVPPGITCTLTGTMATVAIVCAPAFNPADEEIYD